MSQWPFLLWPEDNGKCHPKTLCTGVSRRYIFVTIALYWFYSRRCPAKDCGMCPASEPDRSWLIYIVQELLIAKSFAFFCTSLQRRCFGCVWWDNLMLWKGLIFVLQSPDESCVDCLGNCCSATGVAAWTKDNPWDEVKRFYRVQNPLYLVIVIWWLFEVCLDSGHRLIHAMIPG